MTIVARKACARSSPRAPHFTGELNPRWNNAIFDQLKTMSGQSFEVAYTGEMVAE